MEEFIKLPPHSIEAEMSLLGALLIDNSAFDRMADVLSADDFYRSSHATMYDHIRRMLERNKPADVITLAEALETAGVLEEVGGLSYIATLAGNSTGSGNIRRYAEIIREKASARGLIAALAQIQEEMYSTGDFEEKLNRAQSAVMSISDKVQTSDPVPVSRILPRCMDRIDEAFQGNIQSISTGFIDLDAKLGGGFEAGDLVIVAARPSMGKTALVTQIAGNIQTSEKAALVFTCEMSNGQIVFRLISSASKVSTDKFRTGKLTDDDWQNLTFAAGKLSDVNIFVDDKTFTLNGIRAKSRTVKRKHGLSCIVVDYLQLLHGEGDSREQQISALSRGLKAIAKELEVPVIALSQLSRKCEDRADKRPMMSDLRESGAIEQDADIIMFIYRDEYYNPDSPYAGIAEINISKNRNGQIGRVLLTFDKEHTAFHSYAGQVTEIRTPLPKRNRGFD